MIEILLAATAASYVPQPEEIILTSPHGTAQVQVPKVIEPTAKYKLVKVKPTIKERAASAWNATKNGVKKGTRATYIYTKKVCVKTKPIVEWGGSVAQMLQYLTGRK